MATVSNGNYAGNRALSEEMHSPLAQPNALNLAFMQLDAVLRANQALWRPQPFTGGDLPWYHSHPHLRSALLALDDAEAHRLSDDVQQRAQWFAQFEPELVDALAGFTPGPAPLCVPPGLDRFDSVHIPGRKWKQIIAFAGALPVRGLPVVDWCAGKGHLSRIVQRSQQQTVHCLEYNPELVAAGKKLASKHALDIHYHLHDVTQPAPSDCSHAELAHIALHACGDLHIQLLQHVAASGARAMALSPCCYHKIAEAAYQPLSRAARLNPLHLDRPTLRLAVQDTVTARGGERQLREQERRWRLGFDALQREVRQCDNYLPVPSIKRELLRQDFAQFCQWAAQQRQLTLPRTLDYDHYLRLGSEHSRHIFRLDLLRRLFGRPLELWLVLDRALFLQEHGYRVSITQFCARQETPRNLLLQAELA
jgi:hypothetical protein